MAKHNTKPEVSISNALRRLKVGYVSIRHYIHKTHMTHYYSRYPCLDLKGDWLAETGFSTNTSVTMIIEQGKLMIRPLAEY
ncbi:type I toxin-antitoxin system SymE family toxin [Rosenbergiella epipactidis]|uniref:SymE family type I addiction module toxin n=1 Tax=Rosenbergiella epipactidis TaxID=1544694 RepID=UPI002026B298|nr:SymE family type I addiction module toxin [Rosenbergiella epipactidis]MCL9666958.1 type I toxin-antitoxin system SymE family toxin [Rosenbergiella epipactidis]